MKVLKLIVVLLVLLLSIAWTVLITLCIGIGWLSSTRGVHLFQKLRMMTPATGHRILLRLNDVADKLTAMDTPEPSIYQEDSYHD